MFTSWDEQLQELVLQRRWKDIISLGVTIPLEEKSRYLWAWPSEDSLIFLKNELKAAGVSRILSIGCGSGLLEWIIRESIAGISVFGVELDNSWWKSSYSPKTFIDLSFAGNEVTPNFLQEACASNDWNFALLFCYFNNHEAFIRYLDAYHGKYLVIIGPGNDCGRHTDPQPFELNLKDNKERWRLVSSCHIGNSVDFIAIYIKILDE